MQCVLQGVLSPYAKPPIYRGLRGLQIQSPSINSYLLPLIILHHMQVFQKSKTYCDNSFTTHAEPMLSSCLRWFATGISHPIRHLFAHFKLNPWMSAFQCRKNHQKRLSVAQDMAQTMSKGQEVQKIRKFTKFNN